MLANVARWLLYCHIIAIQKRSVGRSGGRYYRHGIEITDTYGSIDMAACRFYRDPLREVNFICLKTVIRLIFQGIKVTQNKVLSTKTYVDKSNFSRLLY